jgi:hypothetical protein
MAARLSTHIPKTSEMFYQITGRAKSKQTWRKQIIKPVRIWILQGGASIYIYHLVLSQSLQQTSAATASHIQRQGLEMDRELSLRSPENYLKTIQKSSRQSRQRPFNIARTEVNLYRYVKLQVHTYTSSIYIYIYMELPPSYANSLLGQEGFG